MQPIALQLAECPEIISRCLEFCSMHVAQDGFALDHTPEITYEFACSCPQASSGLCLNPKLQ